MFVDASAMIAIVAPEQDGAALAARVDQAGRTVTSAIAIYEAVLGLARRRQMSVAEAEDAVNRFLALSDTEIVTIDTEIGRGALRAFARFGRGRHPAALNTGDCFAYACARALDLPLLFKGEDFGLTDIAPA